MDQRDFEDYFERISPGPNWVWLLGLVVIASLLAWIGYGLYTVFHT